MNAWTQYSQIKQAVEKYWQLQEGKRYEDFIRELTKIMKI